ncbi:MAG TPA: prephenate dehydrogenase/arogenate dehydrogenase family protein [Clostridiales bacterium]|nr:prephenate dehydrogenase/arogenate dehydrogenase family protein [Clostridiales bacterium]
MLNPKYKILIVGLGLIGGSYAEALTDGGFTVGAIDVDKESIDYALEKGIIKDGTVNADEDYISRFDVIIFALYPEKLLKWITENQYKIKSGAILTDVSGVKCATVYPVQAILRQDLEFIGAHPMRGREVLGVKNATKKIFTDCNFIVTPTDKNTANGIAAASDVGAAIGAKKISVITPEEHDEMIGFVSQLTHLIAVALMNCKDSAHLSDYTGDSFHDLTRIAKINEELWCGLFMMNKDALIKDTDAFIEKITEIRDCIKNDDQTKLKELMRISTARRKLFDK